MLKAFLNASYASLCLGLGGCSGAASSASVIRMINPADLYQSIFDQPTEERQARLAALSNSSVKAYFTSMFEQAQAASGSWQIGSIVVSDVRHETPALADSHVLEGLSRAFPKVGDLWRYIGIDPGAMITEPAFNALLDATLAPLAKDTTTLGVIDQEAIADGLYQAFTPPTDTTLRTPSGVCLNPGFAPSNTMSVGSVNGQQLTAQGTLGLVPESRDTEMGRYVGALYSCLGGGCSYASRPQIGPQTSRGELSDALPLGYTSMPRDPGVWINKVPATSEGLSPSLCVTIIGAPTGRSSIRNPMRVINISGLDKDQADVEITDSILSDKSQYR